MLLKLIPLLAFLCVNVNAFQKASVRKAPLTIAYYDFLIPKRNGDNEKKEVGRLIKNIMFPGIYRDYADTAPTKQTIQIDTKKGIFKSRYSNEELQEIKNKPGTFNVADKTVQVSYENTANFKLLPPIRKPANFVAPVPKKQANIDSGVSTLPNINSYPRPKKPIVIYEYESNADCKKVREACSVLDLIVEYRPCPGSTSGFSDILSAATMGERIVPFMTDVNPAMYRPQLTGSDAIVKHLFNTYGPGEASIPKNLKGSGGSKGKTAKTRADARADNVKFKPITLYGFEGAPYVTKVREALNDLGLAHTMVNCAKGSANRAALQKKTGVLQVPFISDPNTGVDMFESAEIVKYLIETYTFKGAYTK
jgi:glutaredoxin